MGYQMLRTAPRQELNLSGAVAAANPGATPVDLPGGGARPSYRRRLMAAMSGTDAVATSRPLPMLELFVPAGALVSVANPYWIIWWASIGMAYLSKSLEHGAAGVGSFFTAHILSDFLWLTFVGFVLASGRRLMSRRAYQGVLMLCGLFLLALGVWFVYSGLSFLA
jgi:threonine/homoserine/homoserine lactone efflux protein